MNSSGTKYEPPSCIMRSARIKNTAAIKAAANLSGNDHLLVAILFQLYLYCVNGAEQGILKSITHL